MKLIVKKAPPRDILADVVRVHASHRIFTSPGDVVIVKIGNTKVYANVRPHDIKGQVCFDLAMRERLGIKLDQEIDVIFEKAGLWGEISWAWVSTDAMPRVAVRISVISLGLGLIGLFLGVASICR